MPRGTGTSKYVAVREHLLARIEDLEPGTRLPAEPTLCEEYGVSRITLRHAVDGLIDDGRLMRQQGRGTFVVDPRYALRYRERFADEVKGFFTQQSEAGFVVTTHVLEQAVIPAGATIAGHLGISSADRIVQLVRLRYVNGSLHHLVRTSLPFALFPEAADVDLTDRSLYVYLTERYHVVLRRNDLLVTLDAASPFVAAQLGVPEGKTLLTVASTVFDVADRAIAHGTSHLVPQHSEISFGLRGR